MDFYSAPTIIVRDVPATAALYESLCFISCGGGEDQVGLRYWMRRQGMRFTVTTTRYTTTGEMVFGDETSPSNEICTEVLVEFANADDANRFIAQWS